MHDFAEEEMELLGQLARLIKAEYQKVKKAYIN